MALVPPNLIYPRSDNPLLNRPSNPRLDIIIRNEPTLTDLWHDFEISVGSWLLSLWHNLCTGLGVRKPESLPQGQSNRACIALMQAIEQEIEHEACSFTQINSDGFAFVLPVEEQ